MKDAGPDLTFTDKDFELVAHAARSAFGLHLETSKKALIQSRLAKRLLATGARTFGEYCSLVQVGGSPERDMFISALTTNVTHFFRERHHFTHLERTVLPALLSDAQKGRQVRIWSAGCSTGQEAYSIAATILSLAPHAPQFDIKILATDVDPKVLETARRGTYYLEDCHFQNAADSRKVFGNISNGDKEGHVRSALKEMVSFQRLNLIESWPQIGSFDVIFCRNVAIYFDREIQSRLWTRFAEKLNRQGHLYIGHSERIHGPAEARLSPVDITTYQLADRRPQNRQTPDKRT